MPLLESAVLLQPRGEPDIDLEFYLSRGRVLLTNKKADGPVKVRVHFNADGTKPAETWTLTLETPDTELALDLFGSYPRDVPFQLKGGPGPTAALFLVMLNGKASAKIGREVYDNLEPSPSPRSLIMWDNVGGMPRSSPMEPRMLVNWDRDYPRPNPVSEQARKMEPEPGELASRIGDGTLDGTLESMIQANKPTDRPTTRLLAVYCLGAIDDTSKVLDVLALEDERQPDLPQAAILTLRHWCGRKADHDAKLYELLISAKRYTPEQAEIVMRLLHEISPQELQKKETWASLVEFLRNDKPAIRQLAFFHLFRLVPEARLSKYNPLGDSTKRESAYAAWQQLLRDNKLPPMGPGIPGIPPTPPPP
jgi:hypothetical protein